MAKNKMMIKVDTLPNGYSLDYDGMGQKGGYMYHSKEELLYGFMAHIGLDITDQLNMETIQDFLVTAINWRDNKKCVKEIEKLTQALRMVRGRRAALAKTAIRERNRYIQLVDDINSLISELKAYPDKDVKRRVDKMLSGRKKMPALTLQGLGVEDDDFIEENEEDEDSE